jgi:hypothetical protein
MLVNFDHVSFSSAALNVFFIYLICFKMRKNLLEMMKNQGKRTIFSMFYTKNKIILAGKIKRKRSVFFEAELLREISEKTFSFIM